MPDVFSLLSDDHRKVDTLFEEFEQTGAPEVALEISRELTIHALLEEELVYPVLATKVDHQMADEGRAEHDQAKHLITQIEAGIGSGEDVSSLVRTLQEEVQHHVEEEENEIFPKMRETLPSVIESMGQEVLDRKQVLLSQMADVLGSAQPPSSLGNKATGS